MKLLMMQRCINPLPFFDQWEGEAAAIYLPYFQHVLGLADLFHPQNEHRIFFTHIYDLGLLLLNGQWDSQLQIVLNAVIHCGTIVGLGWCLAELMGRKYYLWIWLPMALALLSPFGWENSLWGFQSQFYFLLLFSFLTIALLGNEPLSPRWRMGVVAGICALLTMASGLVAAVVVILMIGLDFVKDRHDWRRHLPTLVVCAVLVVSGLLLKSKAPGEETWRAQSVGAFFISLGNNLSWPTGLLPWLAPLNLFPLLALGWFYIRSADKNLRAERLILALGLFSIMQSLATAYARGFEGRPPVWRYMDTLCFLFAANFLSIALLMGKYRMRLRFRPAWYAAFAIWLIPCVISLWALNGRAWNLAVPSWERRQQIRLETMRAFMASNDEKVFANHDDRDIPWVYTPELVFLLRTADIRNILPACARDALKVISADNGVAAFIPNGTHLDKADPPTEHSLGSYSSSGATARGTFESAALHSGLPYLEIPVAGDLGSPGLSLQLVELPSGKISEIKLAHTPGPAWTNAYVKAPAGQFKIIARDDSATGWFAFKEPREMGRLSFWAMNVITFYRYFFGAGILAVIVAIGIYCFPPSAIKNT